MNDGMSRRLRVFDFKDYRAYLAAFFEQKQSVRANWSYGLWARRLGLKSTSSLTKIIQGDREPSLELVDRFVEFFDFDSSEAAYFKDLVQLERQGENARLSALLMKSLEQLVPFTGLKTLSENELSVISKWQYLPLRELVRLKSFVNDYKWMADRFVLPVSPSGIKEGIELLLRNKHLGKTDTGQLRANEPHLHTTTSDVPSESFRKYHKQTLAVAHEVLDAVPVEKREFTSSCFAISEKRLPEAKELIRDFKQRFVKMLEDPESGDSVYQVQIQFFPVIETKRREE